MEYGFVYIWFDRKHERFYVGCHWGNENDGYVCSSPWMKAAYRRRPNDFRRKVVSRVNTNRNDLLAEELRWLSMMRQDQLGKRYYNHSTHMPVHAKGDGFVSDATREKLRKAGLGNKRSLGTKHTPEVIEARASKLRGKKRPAEVGQRISASKIGKTKPQPPCSEETKAKISLANRGRKRTPESIEKQRTALVGRKHTEETKRKMSEAHRKRSLDVTVLV